MSLSQPAPVNPNPRVEIKLRIPVKTVNTIKKLLISGEFTSIYINDFCHEAILEKLSKFEKEKTK